jgi:arsenite methyltransferase
MDDEMTHADQWAAWLLHGRQQGMSQRELRRMQRDLTRLRDRTLRGARLRAGQRVLDVGAGIGLLSVEACRSVGRDGLVCALDLSHAALVEAQRLSMDSPGGAQLAAVAGDALALPFAAAQFDAVLTRSVLIYVDDKAAAAREFYRVLKPGGRASLFEPINSAAQKYGYYGQFDFGARGPAHARVLAYQEAHWPHRSAMLGFDERDLVRWFVAAGFAVTLTYEHTEGPDKTLGSAPRREQQEQIAASLARRYNPTMPSYREAAEAVLGEGAAEHLVSIVNAMLAQPRWQAFGAAYVVARRPLHEPSERHKNAAEPPRA